MKYQNYSTNKSKAERIYNLFLENPTEIFHKSLIFQLFNSKYQDGINYYGLSPLLTRLWRKGKILRTETQLSNGYYYTLRNRNKLDELYHNYLLPYDFKDKQRLITLILKNSFETLKRNHRLSSIRELIFVKRYNKEYFNKKPTKELLAKLIAFVMGDGHLRKNREGIQFFFKEKADAELFKKEFLGIFNKEKIKLSRKKYCYVCENSSRSLVKLLETLGAPVGNKVFQPFQIPDWIIHGQDYIKLAFLSVIYGNEGSKPQDNRWRIQFVISKNKENIKNLLIFLNQIRTMLNHFGISTSFIQLRKQKGRQFCGRFYIKGKENLHKFYKLLEFSYASEKQRYLEALILDGKSPEV